MPSGGVPQGVVTVRIVAVLDAIYSVWPAPVPAVIVTTQFVYALTAQVLLPSVKVEAPPAVAVPETNGACSSSSVLLAMRISRSPNTPTPEITTALMPWLCPPEVAFRPVITLPST